MKSFADELIRGLQSYGYEISDAVNVAIKDVALKVNAEIKSHASFGGTGAYIKSFALKSKKSGDYNRSYIWYVKAPKYRLTHLLERGHRTRSGSSTRAFEHIKYGEQYAIDNLPKKIEEAINEKSK